MQPSQLILCPRYWGVGHPGGKNSLVSFNIRIDTPNIKGIEFKFSEAPDKTKSMAVAIESLHLDKLLIVYPGQESWPVNEMISVCPIDKVKEFLV